MKTSLSTEILVEKEDGVVSSVYGEFGKREHQLAKKGEKMDDSKNLESSVALVDKDNRAILRRQDINNGEASHVKLEKNVGLFGATSLVVGAIIGSGVFMLPKYMYLSSGESPLMTLFLWLVGALVAFGGSICYAELATSITVSGGEQAFLTRMYGPLSGFLFVWTNTLIMNPGGNAAIALFCSEYIVVQINRGWSMNIEKLDETLKNQSSYVQASFAIIVVLIASVVNAISTVYGNKMNEIFSSIKVIAIAIVCSIGLFHLANGEWQQFNTPFITDDTNFSGAINALVLSMWAYGGWSFLTWVTEEIQNPERNIPLSLFIGIGVACGVYICFNAALFCGPVLNYSAKTPLILMFAKGAWGNWGWVLASLCILTSTYGAEASNTISTTRFYHACARDGHLTRVLSLCWAKQATPVVAIVFNFICTSIYILFGKRALDVVDLVVYCQWMFFLAVFIGLIVLRYKEPNLKRPFKAPLIVPILTIIAAAVMIISPFFDSVDDSGVRDWKAIAKKYGSTAAAIVTGIPFYYFCVNRRCRLGIFKKMSSIMIRLGRRCGLE